MIAHERCLTHVCDQKRTRASIAPMQYTPNNTRASTMKLLLPRAPVPIMMMFKSGPVGQQEVEDLITSSRLNCLRSF